MRRLKVGDKVHVKGDPGTETRVIESVAADDGPREEAYFDGDKFFGEDEVIVCGPGCPVCAGVRRQS